MKKCLPNTLNNPRGFTLIELMVVIAIIGILSVIAFGIFSGAQSSARDGRRRIEIDQLAKNIESNRDPATGFYLYTDALFDADYTTGLSDPTANRVYCQAGSTSTTLPTAPTLTTWNLPTACPTGWGSIDDVTLNSVTGVANDITDAGIRSWTVCARLERPLGIFCKSSLIQ